MLALCLALLLASPALDQARQALAAGKLDRVLLALESAASVPAAETAEAVTTLLDAATLARAHRDRPLGLLLAQTALRKAERDDRALRFLADWSREDHEYDQALRYARRRVEARPDDAEAGQLVARIEAQQRAYHPIEIVSKRPRRRQARAWGAAPAAGASSVAAGAEAAARAPSQRTSTSSQVVLYGTAWCGACRTARAWLNGHGIAFSDLDIERDPGAARALREKEVAQGMGHRGVPVIEIDGQLLPAGFSSARVSQALR